MAGYHLADIARGDYGYPSKIFEETEELRDAFEQGNPVMVLAELSDVIGAIEGYLISHHPTITLDDLIVMKDATLRAFACGDRKDRE